jgi:hypothetical protein
MRSGDLLFAMQPSAQPYASTGGQLASPSSSRAGLQRPSPHRPLQNTNLSCTLHLTGPAAVKALSSCAIDGAVLLASAGKDSVLRIW